MPHSLGVDTLDRGSIDSSSVSTLGVIRLSTLRLVVIVAEDTSPLLHGFLVVLGQQSCIRTTMVDLHLWTSTFVTRVH